jgi:quercetin dioxygenase-like cupin family protein
MPKPEPVDHGAIFDVTELDQEVRAEATFERNGYAARTLVRTADLRIVFIAMSEGSHIKEHEASETASIHVVKGHVRVGLADRAADLREGQLLVLDSGLRHDVEAAADSAFLLTLGWSK